MDRDKIITLLEDVKNGTIETAEAVEKLRSLPFQELDFAKIDHHRSLRTGHPEVIFCQGKAPEHVERIYQNMAENNADILLTRADKDLFDRLHAIDSRLRYNELARTILLETSQREKTGHVLIISAGTADLPVAEEAAETAQISGARIEKIYDAGVAGIHRLLAHTYELIWARGIFFERWPVVASHGHRGIPLSAKGCIFRTGPCSPRNRHLSAWPRRVHSH